MNWGLRLGINMTSYCLQKLDFFNNKLHVFFEVGFTDALRGWMHPIFSTALV